MLIAEGSWAHAPSEFRSTIFVHRGVRANLILRRGLLFDSRYADAAPVPPGRVTFLLVQRGSLRVEGNEAVQGPSAWLLSDEEFERRAPSATSFRLGGEPLHVLEFVTMRSSACGTPGLREGPRSIDDALHAALDALIGATGADRLEAFRRVVQRMARSGLIEDALVESIAAPLPDGVERLWNAVARIYTEQDTGAYVALLAELSGVSARQLARDVRQLSSELLLFGGVRASVRLLRLRRAVLLLSAPTLSVTDVARVVGYGGVDAMGRAFRDAGLPPPSVVHRETCDRSI